MKMIEQLKKWWNGGDFSDGGQSVSATAPQFTDDRPAPKRGRPPVAIDGREVARLHDQLGWSFRKIGRHLKHDAGTVLTRYEEWRANHPTRAVELKPETILIVPALPPDFNAALSGLIAPAPAIRAPAPKSTQPEPQTAPIEIPYLFLVSQADAALAVAHGLATIAWGDSAIPALASARRVYLVADEPLRSAILAELANSSIASKVRIAYGDRDALFVLAKRTFVAGQGRQPREFERFAYIPSDSPEPQTPRLIPQMEPMPHGGFAPDTPWPNRALQ